MVVYALALLIAAPDVSEEILEQVRQANTCRVDADCEDARGFFYMLRWNNK